MLKAKIGGGRNGTPGAIRRRYFNWLEEQIHDCNDMRRHNWDRLLRRLFQTSFEWTMVMDGDRAESGVDLRYRFGFEEGYNIRDVDICLQDRPCSVLEMMIALAGKIELVMNDDEAGDRTGVWFFNMIRSLGLGEMDDRKFDVEKVDDILHRFMDRKYRSNGMGGLFTVRNSEEDMREIEIWDQMNIWLIENEKEYEAG